MSTDSHEHATPVAARHLTPLDPHRVPKFVMPLVVPPVMPSSDRGPHEYDIAVRQFQQQVLPEQTTDGQPIGPTTVWSFGAVGAPGTAAEGGSFHYPAFTIEAEWDVPVRVNWINDLVDSEGHYLPHLLPVDQTLHWANPASGEAHRDRKPDHDSTPGVYTGPVPFVTHVHGAETYEWADGYPEAWYLPDADDIPEGYAETGTFYDYYAKKYGLHWARGSATYAYPNRQRATTLWYHDHTLGITRLNVYAGPAGFYLLRGGPADQVRDARTGGPARLPGPAPARGDKPNTVYYEMPIVIQDRCFHTDGSLDYPDNRAAFEGLEPEQLRIPFVPETACAPEGDGEPAPSDVPPIWNPEFFGDVMVVNGQSWPYLEVEPQHYRFRLLNGCGSRFLVLLFDHPDVTVWQIGSDGGFLKEPISITAENGGELLMSPAERADVIVDLTRLEPGTQFVLRNLAPDEPFGEYPVAEADRADAETTGQVMQFRVVASESESSAPDAFTPPEALALPAIPDLPVDVVRQVALVEEESETVRVAISESADGQVQRIALACDDPDAEPFGPTAALLGTLSVTEDQTGVPEALTWMDKITENPAKGAVEAWEIYNFTEDAHPIHIHLVQFQVMNRQLFERDWQGNLNEIGYPRRPERWETGFKDTVIAYPDQVTRVKARFDMEGFYVWHCHILEHEDNEMMRPYHVGPVPDDAPAD